MHMSFYPDRFIAQHVFEAVITKIGSVRTRYGLLSDFEWMEFTTWLREDFASYFSASSAVNLQIRKL